MNRTLIALALAASLSTPAFAQDPAADMAKMGPWSRKPTNEKQTKKEIAEFFKTEEELAKKGDFAGAQARVDFPVFMLTDDSKGAPEAAAWSKEQWTEMMKPFWENMPKDMKVTHKHTITVLSDSLVNVTDDFTMTMGKQKLSGRNQAVLIKKDGAWKWKVMTEAGWGGMGSAPPAEKK